MNTQTELIEPSSNLVGCRLPSGHFNSEWRAASELVECSVSEVDGFIKRHYLGKRPAVVLLSLKMLCLGRPVGCIVFAAPPPETSVRYGGLVWELARLYLIDEVPKNSESWLISKSVKWIKKNVPEVRFLVSYADPSAGHQGIIYKASGWKEDGSTDDERKTPRFDYADKTGKLYGRKAHVPLGIEIEKVPRVSKHRFFLKLR